MLRFFIVQILRATTLIATTLIGTSAVVSAGAGVRSVNNSDHIAQPVQVAVNVNQDAAVRNKGSDYDRIVTRRTVNVSLENVKGFNGAVEFNDFSILPDEEQTIRFRSLKNRDSANNLDLGRIGWGWSTSGGMLRLRATY